MELKVWVEGIQRIVCGVTDSTTCQDVVYALAHATGKTGRFTLIERWRNNERLLAPHEHPLKILTKWGEYSNDVQFILQRSAFDSSKGMGPQVKPKVPDSLPGFLPSTSSPVAGLNDSYDGQQGVCHTPDRNKDIRKSLTFSGGHHGHGFSELRRGDNVGIVKGVPQVKSSLEVRDDSAGNGSPKLLLSGDENRSPSQDGGPSPVKREAPPYREPPCPSSPPQRSLPPYRDPPPPIHSPSRGTPPRTGPSPLQESPGDPLSSKTKPKRNLLKDFQQSTDVEAHQESVLYNTQYRDLVRLVNYQREKLTSQQAELTKFDAEIVFWESKAREQQHQLDYLTQEAARMEKASRMAEDQIRMLSGVEEEKEIVRQQEKTLKSELTLLRSKLANCETELLQCKNKIRLLLEELQLESRARQQHEAEARQGLERGLLVEVERLQRELEQAQRAAELSAQCSETLKREVASIEVSIAEKKRQVECLVAEMKEANLQSLAIAPAEELKHLLEGPHKPGSTRKMIGSPRQLENAVPTSKNPHGVWV